MSRNKEKNEGYAPLNLKGVLTVSEVSPGCYVPLLEMNDGTMFGSPAVFDLSEAMGLVVGFVQMVAEFYSKGGGHDALP